MAAVRNISLLTDFGTRDIYIGVMKGVIDRLAPAVKVIDLSHEVPAQNLEVAAAFLAGAVAYFDPEATLHLVVVDPGVGTARRILYAETDEGRFVAPDNGVLAPQLAGARRVIAVEDRGFALAQVSRTFHGRDLFAPLAARLAAGLDPAGLGPEVTSFEPLPGAAPARRLDGGWQGRIVFFDRFGNAITNIPAGPRGWIEVDGRRIEDAPYCESYAARPPGSALLIDGSFGFLELAVNRGSARERFDLSAGARVRVGGALDRSSPASQSEG